MKTMSTRPATLEEMFDDIEKGVEVRAEREVDWAFELGFAIGANALNDWVDV